MVLCFDDSDDDAAAADDDDDVMQVGWVAVLKDAVQHQYLNLVVVMCSLEAAAAHLVGVMRSLFQCCCQYFLLLLLSSTSLMHLFLFIVLFLSTLTWQFG